MANVRTPRGFTLIEVMIVVAIMAVFAALATARITDSTNDAKEAALKHNIRVLEMQLQLYRRDHPAESPQIQNDGLPQMTKSTNVKGEIGPAGAAYPFGPYVLDIPPNPFDGSCKVTAVRKPGVRPDSVVGSLGGWQYDQSTGTIWPNHPEFYK